MRKALLVAAAVLLMVACQPNNPKQSQAPAKSEGRKTYVFSDIAFAYHGMLLDRDRREIPLDRETLERLQSSMLRSLETSSEDLAFEGVQQRRRSSRLDPRKVASLLDAPNLQKDERVILTSAVIQQAIFAAPPQERDAYQWRFDLIRERLQNYIPRERWGLRPELRVRLTPELLELIAQWQRVRDSEVYVRQCRDAGVPIPPEWPTDAAWRNRGNLPWRYNFLQSGPDTEVWTYEAPSNQGICYALPRRSGADVALAGIICQSKPTGKACFWDNIDAATGRRISGPSIKLRVAELENGATLAENCTDCHRGGNAFLVHPETPLGLGANRFPDVRYQPIGRAAFVNPSPPMAEIGDGECSGCHEVGAPTTSYCVVLSFAADLTMPRASNPANWTTPRAPYDAHIAYFKTHCGL